MTGPSCVVCGSPTKHLKAAGSSFEECASCGYALVDGAAEAEYWGDGEDACSTYWSDAKRHYFLGALREIASVHGGVGKLLDMGGGVGFFAELAIATGWDAISFDISEVATASAMARLGPQRSWSSVPDEAMGTFDAVTIWCVVAHTLDPHSLLESARSALRPGGVLWLTTPNFAFQRAYGAVLQSLGRPLPFLANDHLGQFTSRALGALVEGHGFEDCRYHYVGITEQCSLNGGRSRLLLGGKRAWNSVAIAAMRARLPNLTSELQLTARAR